MRELSQDDLQFVFLWTVLKDAFPTNFFSMKIDSPKGFDAYVMIAQVGNGLGLGPPHHLFALVSTDKFTYVIGKELKVPIKELPQCKAISDSIGTANFDTVFEHYRKCYQKELAGDPQFDAIQKQLETMIKYLEP